jgi:hypothetical protein
MKLLMKRRWKTKNVISGTAMTIRVMAISMVQSADPSAVWAKTPSPSVSVRDRAVSVTTNGQKNSFQ